MVHWAARLDFDTSLYLAWYSGIIITQRKLHFVCEEGFAATASTGALNLAASESMVLWAA